METVVGYLAMGGYGAFVWPAFGLTFLVLGTLLALSLLQLRKRQRRLADLEAAIPLRRRKRP